ncbi:hypothetical protein CROQUDRAFT_660329 [Cronartium quercuum f. sp. fusiforme G11]|uniref:Uncharacterized protein n=1 Tax=Cronartium quercuum f. sp. fusiforme G11 TaxID=708437 RepID=A0A9P6NIB0_9BASI|nr:hypothetical protein CROQUDRAFT_660329 [Cronartium quercuum f. sp. fusiforme G11]
MLPNCNASASKTLINQARNTLPRYLYRMGLSNVLSPRDMRCSVSRIRCDGITLQYGVRALDTDSNSITPNPTDTASHILG